MAITWKLNGTAVGTLGVSGLVLRLTNQAADALTFQCALEDDPSFALNSEIVLTRTVDAGSPVTWFRGRLRALPRRLTPTSETLRFEVLGPWHWLDRTPYLQSWKTPSDPADTASALTTYLRGRAILNQNTSGAKITAKVFIEEVLDYAIAACTAANGGVAPFARDVDASLAVTLPWDEVTDLSCADAISRILAILPDTVAWVDYAPTTPVIHLSRRAELDPLELPVLPPGDSSDFAHAVRGEIDLAPLAEQQRGKVVLIYVQTHRANEAAWETHTIDDHPDGSAPNDPDALVRTIQLAGAVVNNNLLEQPIEIDPLPAGLVYGSATWLTSGSQFDALRTWWRNHAPELQAAGITIKGFAYCGHDATLANELVAGAITDWMIDHADIEEEDATVTAFIAYEEARPNDASKKARHIKQFAARIKATNAVTKTYARTEAVSFTPAEAVPSGLAEQIHAAVSVLHYEGSVVLVETEPTINALVGRTLNLTGDLAAWETMNAVVQSAAIALDDGRTFLRVGPPRHLGVGELVDLFRANRTRRDVVSYLTRTTGKSGGATSRQGLGRHPRAGALASGVAMAPGRYESTITVAGVTPTNTEISTAIVAAYSADNIPVEGDVISLKVSTAVKFEAIVTLTAIAAESWRRVSFTISSVTYYAWVHQVGIY